MRLENGSISPLRSITIAFIDLNGAPKVLIVLCLLRRYSRGDSSNPFNNTDEETCPRDRRSFV